MKFLFLASFLLVCTAVAAVYRTKNITVDDDGSIRITTPTGKQVYINRQVGPNGQKNIEIAISGPNIPTKTIQVDDEYDVEESRLKRGSSKSKSAQGEVLTQILKEYQGAVSDGQYESLLARIRGAVKSGQISPQVFDLLQGLDQQTGVWDQSQGLDGRYSALSGLPQGQQVLYNSPLLARRFPSGLLANQQYPLWNVLAGVPQTRTVFGLNPIDTVQQAEQAIRQLEAVQQQLQQQIDTIQQQQQIAQLSGVRQLGQLVPQLQSGDVQQLVNQLQGQQLVNQLPGIQGQWNVPQWTTYPYQGQRSSVPLTLQQLIRIPQTRGLDLYSNQLYQPSYLNAVPQVQVY